MHFFNDKGLSKMKYSRQLQELKKEMAYIKNAVFDLNKTILSPHTGNLWKIYPKNKPIVY